jgi:hypothetical protein
MADLERARDRVAAAERRIDNDLMGNSKRGRAGLKRAQLELSVISHSYARAASLSDAFGSVTPLSKSVTVRTGGRAISVEKSRLQERASTSANVTVGRRGRVAIVWVRCTALMPKARQELLEGLNFLPTGRTPTASFGASGLP